MYGQTTNIGIARQESWGAANVSSLFWIPFISESIGVDIPPLVSQANRGVFDEGEHYAGPKMVTGDLNVEAQPIAVGAMLAAFFGEPTTTKADSADVYTHVFKASQTDFDRNCAKAPTTVLKNYDASSAAQFSDLNANTLSLSISNGDFLNLTLGFVGGHYQALGAISPSFPAGKRWTWDQSSFRDASSGSTDLELGVTELSITMTENLEAQHTMVASSWPNRIKRTGFRTTEVSGTMKFESMEVYEQFLTQGEQLIRFGWDGSVEISSGYYDNIRVDVYLNRYTEFKPVAGGPGDIEVSFTSKGVYSSVAGASATITLVNTQVSY